jgi:hypothetical protein
MFVFHGHTATPITCIFHGGQFILAHMRVFCLVRSAKTTIFRLATGVTQMPGRIRNRTTIFTGISHNNVPPISDYRLLTYSINKVAIFNV